MNNIEELLSIIYSMESHVNTDYFNKTKFGVGVGSTTYGEITYDGVESLVKYFKKHFNDRTVFYDLGCGLGKMVTQIGLKYGVKKSCGIEYSKERYKGCMDNLRLCKNYVGNIKFIEGSYWDMDFGDATIIYCDDTVIISTEDRERLHSLAPKGCLVLTRTRLKDKKQDVVDSSSENKFFPTTYSKRDPIFFYIKK